MNEEPVISDELQSLVGVEYGPEIYEIEKGMVRKFAEAINDPNPLWQKVTPPTFIAALVPTGLLHKMTSAKSSLKRFLNGSSDLEYLQPIRVGDVIAVTSRLDKLRKMEGKEGATLFMIMEATYKNQDAVVVARVRNTYIRY